MEMIGVAVVNGHRVELTLKVDDEAARSLSVGRADERLRLLLSSESQRAAEIVAVAVKDAKAEAERPPRAAAPAGPHQVAFAGTKEPAVEMPPKE